MKVALIYPALDWEKGYHHHSLPLGILYLTSVLKKEKMEVDVYDTRFHKDEEISIDYDIIGFSAFTMQMPRALEIQKKLKERGYRGKIIYGGPHASVQTNELIRMEGVDAAFIGEAELSLPLYLRYLQGKEKKENLQRVHIKEKNKIEVYPEGEWIRHLDTIPYPDRSVYNMEEILKDPIRYPVFQKGWRYINLTTTRGCPYDCKFCQPTKRILFGDKIRQRSVDNILGEIELCKESFNINSVSIDDDTFTFNMKRLKSFCEGMIERKLNLQWSCQTRSDMKIEMLSLMKESGCSGVYVGVETGSQRMLDIMGKHNTVEHSHEIIEGCKEVGIKVFANMMVGYPGEKEEDLEKSFQFIQKSNPDYVSVSQVTPFPKTYLWDENADDIMTSDFTSIARHVYTPKFKSMEAKQDLLEEYSRKMSKTLPPTAMEDFIAFLEDQIDEYREERPGKKRTIIFGAGVNGEALYPLVEKKGLELVAFLDNDKNKQGKSFQGIPIEGREQIEKLAPDLVLISSMSRGIEINEEIFPQCDQLGARIIYY